MIIHNMQLSWLWQRYFWQALVSVVWHDQWSHMINTLCACFWINCCMIRNHKQVSEMMICFPILQPSHIKASYFDDMPLLFPLTVLDISWGLKVPWMNRKIKKVLNLSKVTAKGGSRIRKDSFISSTIAQFRLLFNLETFNCSISYLSSGMGPSGNSTWCCRYWGRGLLTKQFNE